MNECNLNKYVVFTNIKEQIIANVNKSLERMKYDSNNLETLCLENLTTDSVIKNAVLLLSDFIVDRDSFIPVIHKIIANVLIEMDLDNTQWEIGSDEHLIEFTKKMTEQIIKLLSIQLTSDKVTWNIEDGLKNKDFLYAQLLSNKKQKISIEPYRIKNLPAFQKELFKFLAPSLDADKIELKAPIFPEDSETTPVFKIVED